MHSSTLSMLVLLAALLSVAALNAQNSDQPAYLNTALSVEQRSADLVRRMTVQEKVSQLVNQPRRSPPECTRLRLVERGAARRSEQRWRHHISRAGRPGRDI